MTPIVGVLGALAAGDRISGSGARKTNQDSLCLALSR